MNIILNFVSIEESGSFFINLAKLEKLTFAARSNEVICPFFQECGDPGTFVRHDIYKVSSNILKFSPSRKTSISAFY